MSETPSRTSRRRHPSDRSKVGNIVDPGLSTGERNEQSDEWFEEWFRSEFYLKLYSHRDKQEAEACVNLIVSATELDPASTPPPRALDLACGPGRHAISMAQHGFDVTAVDLSPTLLKYGRAAAHRAHVAVDFVQSDMRTVVFNHEFNLVVQLFTSFGYFDDPADDRLVLRCVRRALRKGGYYVLDLLNERHLRRNLVRTSLKHYHGEDIHEERHFDGDRVVKTISIPVDGEVRNYSESVRLFSPEQISALLAEAGLKPVKWFGDYSGSAFDEEMSPRMVIVSRGM